MHSEVMSELGLAFQRARVQKPNITIVLTYFAHVFISIYNLAHTGRCDNFRAQRL